MEISAVASEDKDRDDRHVVVSQSGGEDVQGKESGAEIYPGQPREVSLLS